MTISKKNKELTQTSLRNQIKQRKGWYFVAFAKELPKHRPYGFTLYNKPFVLLRNEVGKLICYLLPLPDDISNHDDTCVKTFPVVEKQGLIWLWQKSEEANDNLIPTINNLDELLEEDIKMVDP